MTVTSPDIIACFSKHDKPSATGMYKYGEIGSPCLIPLLGMKSSVQAPLNKTKKDNVLPS